MNENRTEIRGIDFWFYWWSVNTVTYSIVAGIIAGVVAGGIVSILFIAYGVTIWLGAGVAVLGLCLLFGSLWFLGKAQQTIINRYVRDIEDWTGMILFTTILGLVVGYMALDGSPVFPTNAIVPKSGAYYTEAAYWERTELKHVLFLVVNGQRMAIAVMGLTSIGQWLSLSHKLSRAFWLVPFTVMGAILSVYFGSLLAPSDTVFVIVVIAGIQASQATALTIALKQSQSTRRGVIFDLWAIGLLILMRLVIYNFGWGLELLRLDNLVVVYW